MVSEPFDSQDMATATRSRSTEDSWRDMDNRLQEVSKACHKQIEQNTAAMESKILNKIDQLVSLVTNCEAKIELYISTTEDRINNRIRGVFKSFNLVKSVGRDGEALVDKSPILRTPGSSHNIRRM